MIFIRISFAPKGSIAVAKVKGESKAVAKVKGESKAAINA